MLNPIQTASIGQPITRSRISFFPVYLHHNHVPAIEAGTDERIMIEELDHATVPSLLATNLSDSLLLLAAGKHFVGGLQNRTINVSVLILAKSKQEIPVSCLEEGRWSNRRRFETSGFATRKARQAVNRDLHHSPLRHSNQQRVWAAVEDEISESNVPTATYALHDVEKVYLHKTGLAEEVEELVELGPLAQQCGIIVAHGSEPVAIEIFGTPRLLKDHWDGLIRSYMLESTYRREQPSSTRAMAMLSSFGNAVANAKGQEAVGLGTEYHVGNDRYTGHALFYKDGLAHACDFSI